MSGLTLDEVVLDFASSSVDVSGSEVSLDAATLAALESVTVSATDLDIRDLINTQDSIAIGDETSIVDMATMDAAFSATSVGFPIMGIRQDAGGSPVSATGDAHPLVFNGSGELKVAANLSSSVSDDEPYTEMPIAVGGRGVSGALTALSASGDKFDLLGDLYRRQWVNTSYNVGIEITREVVGATAAEVVSTPMAGRRSVTIQNASNNSVWLGHDSGVTADDAATGGLEIKKNTSYTDEFGEDIDIWLISDGAGRNVKILEKG